MKYNSITICLLLLATMATKNAFSQKKVNVTFEKIKEECKDLPKENRIRVTVARFSVTTTAPAEFGGNLATMLTNALQEVNCYNVLESLKNKSDMNDEIDYAQSGYANKSTMAKKGKQLGAQEIITGEITEYSVKKSGFGVTLLSVGSNKVKIGFILKVINPETREVLFSKSINVEGKAGSGVSFGLFGANVVSSQTMDPAVANACEQGIIQAVQYLASLSNNAQNSPNNTATLKNTSGTNQTEITLTRANFNSFNNLATIISAIPAFKSMEKSLVSGTATYTVSHTGTDDDFLTQLNQAIGKNYEVTGFEQGKIEIKTK